MQLSREKEVQIQPKSRQSPVESSPFTKANMKRVPTTETDRPFILKQLGKSQPGRSAPCYFFFPLTVKKKS